MSSEPSKTITPAPTSNRQLWLARTILWGSMFGAAYLALIGDDLLALIVALILLLTLRDVEDEA